MANYYGSWFGLVFGRLSNSTDERRFKGTECRSTLQEHCCCCCCRLTTSTGSNKLQWVLSAASRVISRRRNHVEVQKPDITARGLRTMHCIRVNNVIDIDNWSQVQNDVNRKQLISFQKDVTASMADIRSVPRRSGKYWNPSFVSISRCSFVRWRRYSFVQMLICWL